MASHLVCIVAAATIALTSTVSGASAAPDIAILLTDQQQAAAMSVVGTPGVNTPNMDALAREKIRFTHAHCATPQCSPARAALWTGRYPHRTGVMGNVGGRRQTPAGMSAPLDPSVPGIGKTFTAAGYDTAYFGKWHLGNDPGIHGFGTHDIKVKDRGLAGRVVEFLNRREEAEGRKLPLLLIASWVNPHDIYYVNRPTAQTLKPSASIRLPASWSDDLSRKPFPQRHFLDKDQGGPFGTYTEDSWRRYLTFYYQLNEKVDAQIGEVVRALRKTNPNILIVFTSDHGDLAGAHGMPYKGPAMYEELVRIPFVISWPGQIKPSVSDALVSQIDLLPTLCDLAGVEAHEGIDGKSMRPLLGGNQPAAGAWRDAVFAEYYGKQNWRVPIRMVRTSSWKYVRYRRYGEELYDLAKDPHELSNLAGRPEHEARRKELADRLDRWIERTNDPFPRLSVTDRTGQSLPAN